jgi:hypothetical protein
MYPYDFTPTLKGLNPEEVFVVMPFAPEYDQIYTDLVEPAVDYAATHLKRRLVAYRTKGDLRTTSGWLEVMEHLYSAQVVLGVLTKLVNANVQYELGIAHATQPIQRQVLIAEEGYKPAFDTKDLIFMQYSPRSLGDSVEELAGRIQTALQEWEVKREAIVRHAIAKITPFEFEVLMQWCSTSRFAVSTSASGPGDYDRHMALLHGEDKRFMEGVFQRHCNAIGLLQGNGLLGFFTQANPPRVEFTYYWTDLGNLVLCSFGLIDDAERRRRYEDMPAFLRRIS